MSGLDIVYNGKNLVEKIRHKIFLTSKTRLKRIQLHFSANSSINSSLLIKLKRLLKIQLLTSRFKRGDLIIRINRKSAYYCQLKDMVNEFSEKVNKKIQLKIKRGGIEMTFKFRLEKRI